VAPRVLLTSDFGLAFVVQRLGGVLPSSRGWNDGVWWVACILKDGFQAVL